MTKIEPKKDEVEITKEQRDFVEREKIEKYLTCPICTEIFDNPIRITCGHTFCDDCLSEWGKKSNNFCPLCRKKFLTEYSGKDLIAQSIINDAIVHCIYKGCPWKDKLSNLKSHIHTCIFDPAHCPDFISKGNKLEEKKNESDEEIGNVTSFNVHSSLKERIFARNPELVTDTFNLRDDHKEEENKELDEDDNEIIQLPRSEQPYRARRGRPKANHRPIFAVHTDVRNTQRIISRNNNRNIQRNNLNHSSSNIDSRMNRDINRPQNNNTNQIKRGPGRPRERKNAVSITFNQSIINPNVNHIINSNSSSNINHNSRPAPGPLPASDAPRPVQRNNNINNSNNISQSSISRPIQRNNNINSFNNINQNSSSRPIQRNNNINSINNINQNSNSRPVQRINSNIHRPNQLNHNHFNNQIISQNKNFNQINNNRIHNNNNQRINPINNNLQRFNQQQKINNTNQLINSVLINQQRNTLQKNNMSNLNNSLNKSKNIPLHNSQSNLRLNNSSNHINSHPNQNNHSNNNIGPINTVLNNQIERILEMNMKNKSEIIPPNNNNTNNKMNEIKNNKMNGVNGIKNKNMNQIDNFSNQNKKNDPQDFYNIISERVNGMMESGMSKKNVKRKNKVNKDEDLNDFKLLGRKTSKQ